MSRIKREGFYAGKHEGKHFRCPIVLKLWNRKMCEFPKKERQPNWENAMIEALRKGL